MTKKEKHVFMRELWTLSVPIALQNLMLCLLSASDSFILAKVGQTAVSAVALGSQVAFILSLIWGSVTTGACILASQYWGKGDKETVRKLFALSLRYAFAVSLLFFVGVFFFPRTIMSLYSNDAATINAGAGYLKIVSWSYLLAGASQVYLGMMKIAGRVKQSAVIALIAFASNVILDIIFVYGFCGLPRMEVQGAAAATVGVCFVEFAYVYWESLAHIHPAVKNMTEFYPLLEKDFYKVAFPVLGSGLVWGVGFSAYFGFMGHINPDASAAYSISSVIRELVNCISSGASGASAIIIGRMLGSGKITAAKEGGAFIAKLSFLLGGISALVMLLIGAPLSHFFVLTAEADGYLQKMLLLSSFYMFGRSLNSIVVCGLFASGGDTVYDTISTFISMWLFAIPLALLGAFYFHWPVMVVYLMVSSDEIIKLPFIYPRYKKYYWLKNLTRENI